MSQLGIGFAGLGGEGDELAKRRRATEKPWYARPVEYTAFIAVLMLSFFTFAQWRISNHFDNDEINKTLYSGALGLLTIIPAMLLKWRDELVKDKCQSNDTDAERDDSQMMSETRANGGGK